MSWTAAWVNGEVVTHTKLNSMRDDDANWKGNVNAGGFNLSNLGQITGAVMVINGPLTAIHNSYDGITSRGSSNNAISLRIQNTFTGARYWNLASSGGGIAPIGCFGIWDDTAGASRLVIDVSGNVGIGTTVPDSLLNIGGGTAATTLAVYGNVSGSKNSYVKLRDVAGSAIGLVAGVGGLITMKLEGGSGTSYFNGGGNVGIGTILPTAKLHVVGLASYVNNAAAIAAGLTAGAFYIVTSSNPAQVAVVV